MNRVFFGIELVDIGSYFFKAAFYGFDPCGNMMLRFTLACFIDSD
jgi:hypothetical protein